MHACWHITHGPFATVRAAEGQAPRVDAFHTLYTLKLRPVDGQYTGTFAYRAFATGNFIVYLSAPDVPLALHEGHRPVEIIAEKPTSACEGLRLMRGVELTKGVTYTLTLGPTSVAEPRLVIEYLQ